MHYDYNEIASRYTGANATRDFVKYISTSKETLRNIEVSESSIKLKNGWSMLADKMNGCPIWSDKEEDELIYPGDNTFIHDFNNKVESDYRFVVGVPPMPFSGNLLKSKVVIVQGNKEITIGKSLFLGLPLMPTGSHQKKLGIQSMRILHSCS